MSRLFGTDGVRGLANRDLTADLALGLAVAAARVVPRSGRAHAVVGFDPRASSEFLEAAVVAGLASAGVDVLRVGMVPTPAVAYLTRHTGASLGVMISASHNAMPDNGIKFFAEGGHKLPDEVEDAIEVAIAGTWERPTGAGVGRVRDASEGISTYEQALLDAVTPSLEGLRVVVDCANGAASRVSPEVLRRAGAEVIAIHSTPDGLNINAGCGSTHLDDLVSAVRERGAHAGIAHDGDADRCLAVDAEGNVIDGDQIMAVLAMRMRNQGALAHGTVVATVMSNLGFRIAMQDQGITVIDTAVGDRYVLEEMRRGGYSLGGEQSGHVVMLDHATTGDGVLTALSLLDAVASSGVSLRELAGVMTRLPQVLINVKGVSRERLAACAEVAAEVASVEAELGHTGRVLLRPSGTEPLIRVMVEAPTYEAASGAAERIAGAVRTHLAV